MSDNKRSSENAAVKSSDNSGKGCFENDWETINWDTVSSTHPPADLSGGCASSLALLDAFLGIGYLNQDISHPDIHVPVFLPRYSPPCDPLIPVNPFSCDFDSPPFPDNQDDNGLPFGSFDVPSTPLPPVPVPPPRTSSTPLPPTVVDDIRKKRKVDGSPARKPPAWELNYKLGSGAYGTVYLEKVQTPSMRSSELWAVKKISRCSPNFPAKRYQAEINNLQALSNHEWFVKFNSFYEDPDYVYIAMEYIPIGDMSETLVDGYHWNESDTRVVMKQLLNGLAVMHKEGITHRDLKPENVFLHLPENQAYVLHVKIGDFGTSKRISSNASTSLKTTTGTQEYMAPEVHDTAQPKTNRVDIWSLGCILYRMVTGSPLFKDPVEVWKYTLTASSSPLAVENIDLSALCVSFLRDILQPGPEDRPSAEACLRKAWIMNEVAGSEYIIGKDLHTRLLNVKLGAPDIDSFSHVVAKRVADRTHTRSLLTGDTSDRPDGKHTETHRRSRYSENP